MSNESKKDLTHINQKNEPRYCIRLIDYGVLVHTLPKGLKRADKKAYQFFVNSKKVWKIDQIDRYNQIWIAREFNSNHWESLRLEPNSFDCIPCQPAYSVQCEN